MKDIAAWCGIGVGLYSNPLFYAKHLYSDNDTEITDLVIPDGVTSIGRYAFSGCCGLTSVTIGNSVTSIGSGAFLACCGLTSVTIGNSVTSIGSEAFSECECLTSVTIGNSVTSIGSEAFNRCPALTSVHILDVAAWCKIKFDYASGIFHHVKHLYLNGEETKDLVIPNSVTEIGSYAFFGCNALTSVTIGNSVTSIGSDAFFGCNGLMSVTIGNSVTSIGEYAFYQCTALKSVTLGNSVTEIDKDAFWECDKLTTLYSFNTTPPSVASYNFEDRYRTINVFVPQGALEAYQNASPWKNFRKLQEMETTGIDDVIVNVREAKENKRHDAAGREIGGYRKGLNIIKKNDGTTKKVMVK